MKRKPRIEYYWARNPHPVPQTVNVRIFAANGVQVGQITQGSKDKRDARRCVNALCVALGAAWVNGDGDDHFVEELVASGFLREVGPGPRPK